MGSFGLRGRLVREGKGGIWQAEISMEPLQFELEILGRLIASEESSPNAQGYRIPLSGRRAGVGVVTQV